MRLLLALGLGAALGAWIGASALGVIGTSGPVSLPPLPTLKPEPTPADSHWIVRVPRPTPPAGARRVGIQSGHWQTSEVPEELAKLRDLGGALWDDVYEWEYVLDITRRVATRLEAKGFAVDILPTTVPEGYLADVFVSLHADGDETGTARGFKVARGQRRGPYEDALVEILRQEYWKLTNLPEDPNITEDMDDYYAFRWERFSHSVEPHTPAAIIEMGFITSAADRAVLLGRRDAVAEGVANGILRFLAEVPRTSIFRDDLVLPRATPSPATEP
jgi:N-acetylmuramoyl-L-alanine amidase